MAMILVRMKRIAEDGCRPFQVAPIIVYSAWFLSTRTSGEDIDRVGDVLNQIMQAIRNPFDLNIKGSEVLAKIKTFSRIMRVKGEASCEYLDRFMSADALSRIGDFADVLATHFFPQPFHPDVPLRDIKANILRMFAAREGLSSNSPPDESPKVDLRDHDHNWLLRMNVLNHTPEHGYSTDADDVGNLKRVGEIAVNQSRFLAHALRSHNADAQNKPMIVQGVLEDIMSQLHDLPMLPVCGSDSSGDIARCVQGLAFMVAQVGY